MSPSFYLICDHSSIFLFCFVFHNWPFSRELIKYFVESFHLNLSDLFLWTDLNHIFWGRIWQRWQTFLSLSYQGYMKSLCLTTGDGTIGHVGGVVSVRFLYLKSLFSLCMPQMLWGRYLENFPELCSSLNVCTLVLAFMEDSHLQQLLLWRWYWDFVFIIPSILLNGIFL